MVRRFPAGIVAAGWESGESGSGGGGGDGVAGA